MKKLPMLGAAAGGGFFAGLYLQGNELRRLYVSGPEGEFKDQVWAPGTEIVKGALSLEDGLANTKAMVKAGSLAAKLVIALRLGKQKDWCIGAHDQMWAAFKNLKFNAAAAALLKKNGGGEFIDGAYWTSTQYRADGDYAWYQGFTEGGQHYWLKCNRFMVRAVRSEPI